MTVRTQIKLALGLALVMLIAYGVQNFIYTQRAIGALQVRIEQESKLRDSLSLVDSIRQQSLTVAYARIVALDSAEARALRRAKRAEANYASVSARVDTLYRDAPDSTLVPLTLLREVQDAGHSALSACTIARDTLQLAKDSLTSACALERKRADDAELRAASFERENVLLKSTPTLPEGRGSFGRGVVVGAGVITALVTLLALVLR